MPTTPSPSSAAASEFTPRFGAPAAGALAAVIETGARLFIAEPWRVARIMRDADAMTVAELCAQMGRRRRAGAPADLNRAIALAQLSRALQAPAFAAAWADWRARAAGG